MLQGNKVNIERSVVMLSHSKQTRTHTQTHVPCLIKIQSANKTRPNRKANSLQNRDFTCNNLMQSPRPVVRDCDTHFFFRKSTYAVRAHRINVIFMSTHKIAYIFTHITNEEGAAEIKLFTGVEIACTTKANKLIYTEPHLLINDTSA